MYFGTCPLTGLGSAAVKAPTLLTMCLGAAGWEGPPPPRGCEVFVGKIPRDMYEDELVPLFERAGRIYEFRLMMEFSGENRGYAFVMYTNR